MLFFSPGYGVERQLCAALAEDLASHGYVVAALDHPHDANIVAFPDGHAVVRGSVPETQAAINAALTVRVADTEFALHALTQLNASASVSPFRGRLDLSRVGMFGHSLGGATAAAVMLADPRIRAGADLDGYLFGPVRRQGLARPFLLITGDPGFRKQMNFAHFWRKLRGPHYAIDPTGAQHLSFTDLVNLAPGIVHANPKLRGPIAQLVGTIDPTQATTAERSYLRAFFDRYLLGHHSRVLTHSPFTAAHLTIGRH